MPGSIYDWTISPDANATNDGDINWQEFQDPATVNNSARRGMGRIAEFLGDLAPGRTSTGGSNVYNVVANSAPVTVALPNGFVVSFIAHQANTGACVLAVNSFASSPLRAVTGQSLLKGAIQPGMPITAFYKADTNEFLALGTGANVAAYLTAFQSVDLTARLIKVGMVFPWPGATLPGGYIYAAGQAVSRTDYAELFAAYGTTYGAGDGSTTFNVPDYRGRALFGDDNMGGTTAGRITSAGSGISGTTLGATGGAETVTLAQSDLPNIRPTFTGNAVPDHTHTYTQFKVGESGVDAQGGGNRGTQTASTGSAGGHTPSGTISSINGGVTQTAVNKMPPCAICNWIIFASPPLAAAGALGTNGLQFNFDSGTTDADPGAGNLRFDNAAPASATHVYVSKTDAVGADQTQNLTNIFGSASSTKGTVLINKVGTQGTCFSCLVTAIDTSADNYIKLTIQNPSFAGSLAAGDSLGVQTSRTGDPGAQGAKGAVTLANGLNSDIANSGATSDRITGPTSSFSVGGIAGGVDGTVKRLYNTTSQAMTIVNGDALSAAANRIKTLTGADVLLRSGTSYASLEYDGTESLWILMSTN